MGRGRLKEAPDIAFAETRGRGRPGVSREQPLAEYQQTTLAMPSAAEGRKENRASAISFRLMMRWAITLGAARGGYRAECRITQVTRQIKRVIALYRLHQDFSRHAGSLLSIACRAAEAAASLCTPDTYAHGKASRDNDLGA